MLFLLAAEEGEHGSSHGEVTGDHNLNPEGHHGGHEESEEENEHWQPEILLFVFIGLLLGGLLREFNKKTKFPYTPMLIIAGIIMGHWANEMGVIGESTIILSHINPHILLFVFIPVLIFESAFNCDWHIFRKSLVNILLLAGPGVLFGAFLIAVIFKVLLGYTDEDMTWWGALMAGSVLSATDPVAVVALFKELGADPRFGHLVEGESLLNDGTAMVFYQLFLTLTKGEASTPGAVVVSFIRIAGGGPVLGFCFGLISSLWLRRVIRDDVLTSTITVFTCYITFYCAEFTGLHVSGILAIVVLGLFMSAFGKTSIYSESEHAVHTVWSFTQFGCETIIFLLTGVLIGIQMIEKSTITSSDWIKLFLFYGLTTVSRAIMVWCLWPLLNRFGYGLSRNQFYVLVWGGLRGALGLTLSLMVGVDEGLEKRLRELTVFYMCGLATLTLLINGTTCKALVLHLKLIDNPPIKEKLLRNAKQQLYLKTIHKKENISQDQYLNFSKWDEVDDLIGLKELKDQIDHIGDRKSVADDPERRSTTFAGYDPEEVHGEARFRMLRTLKSLVWERYEKGHTSGEATRILDQSIDIALDQTKKPIQLWANTYDNFTQLKMLKQMFKIKDWPLFGSLAQSYITRHLALIYESSTTFIQCVNETVEIQESSTFKNTWIKKVIHECEAEVDLAERYLTDLMDQFDNIVSSIHTKRAAMELLEYHKRFISEYRSKGYIDDNDFASMEKNIDRRMVQLENHIFNWKAADFNMLFVEFPIFKSLDAKQQQIIQASSKQMTFKEGEIIFKQGEEIKYIFVVMKGSVKDESKQKEGEIYDTTSGIGALLNYGNIVFQRFNVSTCTANSNVTVRAIEFDLIKKLIDQNALFEERIYKGALVYCVRCHMTKAKEFGELTETQINKVAQDAKTRLHVLSPGSEVDASNGAYVFSGQVTRKRTSQQLENEPVFDEYSYISPKYENLITKKKSYVLQFSGVIKKHLTIEQFEIEVERKYETQQVKNSDAYINDDPEQGLKEKLI